MKAFLDLVAEAYMANERDSLAEFCFVFPNRRSGMFFRRALANAGGKRAFVMPRIATLNELVSDSSDCIEATHAELLLTLHSEYQKIQPIEFDKFYYWGNVLLDDFNDVESNLIDADKIFVNLERWREIKSFYLTDEHIEIIRRYWGDDISPAGVDEFWAHTGDKSSDDFIRLWEVLDTLYDNFTSNLTKRGLASRGMLLRQACDRLADPDDHSSWPLKRYIFVGFDIPTNGELKLFNRLKAVGKADFYWDFNSPLSCDNDNRLASIMRNLKADFTSLYDLKEAQSDKMPSILITGVPSSTGQAKVAGKTLEDWSVRHENKDLNVIADCDNAIDTAVVLPDESLFVPMIHSVPDSLTSMNVTMGFPMKFTPIAGLMSVIVSLHLRARIFDDHKEYFYEDVEDLIANPLVKALMPEESDDLINYIRNNHLYSVSSATVKELYPAMELFFTGADDATPDSVNAYICAIIDKFIHSFENKQNYRLEWMFLKAYKEILGQIYEAFRYHSTLTTPAMFMSMVERVVSLQTVNFKGEPLKGLQLMGVLETRALDFRNLIILSMNERIFPKKAQKRSFIPDSIRKAYGLPTSEMKELQYAYYFFRLISRAERVVMLYDNRMAGATSNELSRYLTQLLYLYGDKNTLHHNTYFTGSPVVKDSIELTKTPEIMKLLGNYARKGGWNLSASALKTYLTCPLQFALSYVMKLRIDDEITDYMDASTLGTIVHEVLQNLYTDPVSYGEPAATSDEDYQKPRDVTERIIERWINNIGTVVEPLITASINLRYNHLDENHKLDKLTGEAWVLGQIIKDIIQSVLRQEKTISPFRFLYAEKNCPTPWTVNPCLTVNFAQVIDRIDCVDGHLRIVDYKTGDEDTDLGYDISKLFVPGSDNKKKSIFQVLLYCELYRKFEHTDAPIQPYIYNLRKATSRGLAPITYKPVKDKEVLVDYHSVSDEFIKGLNGMLEEIFNPDVPFRQTNVESNCVFCKYKEICSREESKLKQ